MEVTSISDNGRAKKELKIHGNIAPHETP